MLFLAKENLIKVEKAAAIATTAVKNEETVVSAAKTVAHVKITEPKKVSSKKIEAKIQESETKVTEDPAIKEAKEPKTNDERKEDNTE